jgi:predicted RNase H-like nuclease (RuvC/YqgF family)
MARKRLGDLLREEATKTETAQPAAKTIEVAAAVVQEASSTSSPPQSAGKTPAKKDAQVSDAGHDAAVNAQLQADLEQARQNEAALQQQVTNLQEKLDQAQQQVQSLQQAVNQLEGLKAELDQAKATALQLAETNASLMKDLEGLRQVSRTPVEVYPTALSPQETMRRQQAASLAHPMFPAGSMPGQLSNQDLGWVD